jgi:hypothetical protein
MNLELLNDQLLNNFIHSFYGYGTYSADYWFIGMEEGGGESLDEVNRRISFWQTRGQQELEDVCAYHEELGLNQFFREPVKLQRTWAQLCRIVLASKGEPQDNHAIRAYQKDKLGRPEGATCLMELLPLPSPGTDRWFYADWSKLPFLSSRSSYRDEVLPMRIKNLKERIEKWQPKFVVFYGTGYRDHWEEISETPFLRIAPHGFDLAKKNTTCFLTIQHPAAKGVSNEYFQSAGKLLLPSRTDPLN